MVNRKPEVSIVVTCFNYGGYVSSCLDSIYSQTFKDFEVIMINDGSTDDSDKIIKKKYLSYPGFKYIYQKNCGQTSSKNSGIEHSQGKFIAFLDADDMWMPTKLEKQMRRFTNKDIGVVYSRARYIDENGQPLQLELKGKYFQPRSGKVTDNLFLDNFIPFSSTVVRKSCFEKFGRFDTSLEMGIDWDLWLRLSTKYLFDYVDEPLLVYRVGHSGQMSKNAEKRMAHSDMIMGNFIKQFPGYISDSVYRKAMAFTFCNRGRYYRKIDTKKSNEFFLKVLKLEPFRIEAYMGIIKNFIRKFKK